MTLSRFRWQEYVPALGNNRELETPLKLEVRTGLTRKELNDWRRRLGENGSETIKALEAAKAVEEVEAIARASTARMAAIVGENIRVVGKHTIDGQPLETVAHYIEVAASLAQGRMVEELTAVVVRCNEFSEDDALFSERLSGGVGTTPRQSAANSKTPTVGR